MADYVEFAYLPCACVGFLSVVWFSCIPKTSIKVNSKLSPGARVRVNGVCVCTVMDW